MNFKDPMSQSVKSVKGDRKSNLQELKRHRENCYVDSKGKSPSAKS